MTDRLNTKAPTTSIFDREPKNLWEAVYQTVGAASVCWEDMSGTGIFQDQQAKDAAESLIQWVRTRLDPDSLALVFKAAWHAADRAGLEGRRTDAGIAAVIGHVLGEVDTDPDQLVLPEVPC
jgi:hypothetical protein